MHTNDFEVYIAMQTFLWIKNKFGLQLKDILLKVNLFQFAAVCLYTYAYMRKYLSYHGHNIILHCTVSHSLRVQNTFLPFLNF